MWKLHCWAGQRSVRGGRTRIGVAPPVGIPLPTSSTLPRGLIVVLAVLASPGAAQASWERDPHYLHHRHRQGVRAGAGPSGPELHAPARQQGGDVPTVEASSPQPDTGEAPEAPVLYPG